MTDIFVGEHSTIRIVMSNVETIETDGTAASNYEITFISGRVISLTGQNATMFSAFLRRPRGP